MKRKTAREILAESFYELSETKDIDKITIREIAENCGYSPATFYRNFRDKYDLIAWAYTESLAKIMGRIESEGYTWEDILLQVAGLFEKERDYLANLLLHTTGHDAFLRHMGNINTETLRSHILRNNGGRKLDERTEAVIRVYCLGTVSLSCEWILGEFTASREELADIYEKALPEVLQPYLNERK